MEGVAPGCKRCEGGARGARTGKWGAIGEGGDGHRHENLEGEQQ